MLPVHFIGNVFLYAFSMSFCRGRSIFPNISFLFLL
jgi:hypothetical protein